MEVFFNATNRVIETGDPGLRGHSYIWMFPIWAATGPIADRVLPKMQKYNALVRGLTYGAVIMAGEYLFGTALRETIGKCPWSEMYEGSPYSIQDIVRLDFYPLWCMAGLGFEQLWKQLNPSGSISAPDTQA